MVPSSLYIDLTGWPRTLQCTFITLIFNASNMYSLEEITEDAQKMYYTQ